MPIVNDDIFEAFKIGIEKESLRVLNKEIAQSPHKKELFGAPLTNQFITTDFSESQMEYVTPPLKTSLEALNFLESIHQNISMKIDNEILWPLSMPPYIDDDSKIPIAYYGESVFAKFKRVYRLGLSNRYGSQMQAISGLHYNFSIEDHMLRYLSQNETEFGRDERDGLYFNALRNIARYNWLLLYFFGASPFVSKSTLGEGDSSFQKLDDHTFYLPFATSLRTSDVGYQNTKQKELKISFNTISEYVHQLNMATKTYSDEFSKINEIDGSKLPQLSPNILQIEDEYYSSCRPKSSSRSGKRMLKNLQENGVDYIELRSIDLNPFNPCGIRSDQLHFLELFLVYCLQKQSHNLNDYSENEIKRNDLLVAKEGRRPGLMITKNKEQISIKDWGLQILDEMEQLISEKNPKKEVFVESLSHSRNLLEDPNLTLSAEVLIQVKEGNMSYEEYGCNLGEAHKKHLIKSFDQKSHNEKIIQNEIERSILELDRIEASSEETFREFLKNYLSD